MDDQLRDGPPRSLGVKLRRTLDTVMRTVFGLALYKQQLRPLFWFAFASYGAVVALSMWAASGWARPCFLPDTDCGTGHTASAATELARAYSPVLLDVGVVALLALVALSAYRVGFGHAAQRYKADRLRRAIEVEGHQAIAIAFDPSVPLHARIVDQHFEFAPALQCTIDASALHSQILFQSTQGGFDLAKLTLLDVVRDESGQVQLQLGSCAFRDLNLAHYWAFVPIASESSDENDQRQKCLFDLLAPTQRATALAWLHGGQTTSAALERSVPRAFAPNPLGVSVLIEVRAGSQKWWLMRERSGHVSADPKVYCAAVAGLIDVFPDFAYGGETAASELLRQEYGDELFKLIHPAHQRAFQFDHLALRPLGLLADPESNYQPELYFHAVVLLDESALASQPLVEPRWSRKGGLRLVGDPNRLPEGGRLRPRDKQAFRAFEAALLDARAASTGG